MKEQRSRNKFEEAVESLADPVRQLLLYIPDAAKEQVHEIRLRVGKPLCLGLAGKTYFVSQKSALALQPKGDSFLVTQEHIQACIRTLCQYSYHSHAQEICQGYISIKGGHRAGICGTAVLDGNQITAVREFTSINLRIARQVSGCADDLLEKLGKDLGGLLIAGAPGSGKTTLLRDLARQYSSPRYDYRKVAIVDERGEIAMEVQGEQDWDVGVCTDVLTGYRKSEGMMMAIRTLSPELIICDEIGTPNEVEAVRSCVNSGVVVITSIHAGTLGELVRRPQALELLSTGAFSKIAFLKGPSAPCQVEQVMEIGEVYDEIARNSSNGFVLHAGRRIGVPQAL